MSDDHGQPIGEHPELAAVAAVETDWQHQAFADTLSLAADRGMDSTVGGPLGFQHLMDMKVQANGMSGAKLGRWLGWAQCAVVAAAIGVTLDDMAEINTRCSGGATDRLRAAARVETPAELACREIQDGVDQLVAWNDEHGVPEYARVMKLSEECGEVTEAYFGHLGLNPRKGVTNGIDAVLVELADAALAALVAIRSLGGSPGHELVGRVKFVKHRLGLDS